MTRFVISRANALMTPFEDGTIATFEVIAPSPAFIVETVGCELQDNPQSICYPP